MTPNFYQLLYQLAWGIKCMGNDHQQSNATLHLFNNPFYN